jgi:hypothetical protein
VGSANAFTLGYICCRKPVLVALVLVLVLVLTLLLVLFVL